MQPVVKLSFDCLSRHFAEVRSEFKKFLATFRLSPEEEMLLVLALDEACTNVLRHAYGKEGGGGIRIRMEKTRRGFRVTLRDYGKPCDPQKIAGRDLGEFRPGGLGVHLIRRAFDEVTYCPQAKGTKLVLVKTVGG